MYNNVNSKHKANLRTLNLVQPVKRVSGRKRLLRAGLRLFLVAASLFLLKQGYALFLIKEVQVSAPVGFKAEDLLRQGEIITGSSIFLLNPERAAQRLMEVPAVLSAEILKIFPSTVTITIEGRVPSAYLLAEGDFWLIDSAGIVYQRGSSISGRLPVVTGAASSLPVLGQPLQDPAQAEAFRLLVAALATAPDLNPSELNLSESDSVVLYTATGVKVLLGDSKNLTRKLTLVREALPYLQEQTGCFILDVRTGDQLVVIDKS